MCPLFVYCLLKYEQMTPKFNLLFGCLWVLRFNILIELIIIHPQIRGKSDICLFSF